MKKSIAIVGTRGIFSEYSGVEIAVQELIPALDSNAYTVRVYCRKGTEEHQTELNENITTIFIPTIESKHFGTFFHTFLSCLHLLVHPVDIVHFHAIGSSFFSFLPKIFRMKTVLTIHGLDWQRKKWSAPAKMCIRICEHIGLACSNTIIVVSHYLHDHYLKHHNKKTTYIPNGTRVHHVKSTPAKTPPKPYMLFVGRLTPEKNVDKLITSFNKIETDIHLYIAGEATSENYGVYLQSLCGPRVHFLGHIPHADIFDYYTDSYCVVLPSDIEGCPLSLLEAMACKKCVICSNINDIREFTALRTMQFKLENAHDLYETLCDALHNPKTIKKLSTDAYAYVCKHHEIQNIAKQIEAIYETL